MKYNRIVIFAFIMVAGIFFTSITCYADVTGTWKMAVQTQAGTGESTFVLTQNGETITGTYKGRLGEAPVTGEIKEGKIILNYTISAMGREMKVQYSGTVEGDTMKGTIEMGGRGGGSFTGKKQVEKK
jgi:hypothetical protein